MKLTANIPFDCPECKSKNTCTVVRVVTSRSTTMTAKKCTSCKKHAGLGQIMAYNDSLKTDKP